MNYKELKEQYTLMHKRPGYGSTGKGCLKNILPIIHDLKPKSILDWGCGRSTLLNLIQEVYDCEGYKYDIGLPKFSKLPKQVDLIICTDVLEHIPENLLDQELNKMKAIGTYFLFAISLRTAGHHLPNGLNCHQTVKSSEWWLEKLYNVFGYAQIILLNNNAKKVLIETHDNTKI